MIGNLYPLTESNLMSKIVTLLKQIGQDAELAERFRTDADAVAAEFQLSEEETAALKSGDVEAVRKLSGLDRLEGTHTVIKAY